MKVLFRAAKVKDSKAMSDLNIANLPEHYSLSFWEDTLGQADGRYSYVAEIGKQIVAYILGDPSYVLSFAVDPKFRTQGIGQNLLCLYLHDACSGKKKALHVSLHVDVENFSAQKLYEKLGFTKTELVKNYYESRQRDGFLMTRDTNLVVPRGFKKLRIRPTTKPLCKNVDKV
jgi:ribosomal-protein-alanine N-acetyltransferase